MKAKKKLNSKNANVLIATVFLVILGLYIYFMINSSVTIHIANLALYKTNKPITMYNLNLKNPEDAQKYLYRFSLFVL